MVFVRHRCEKCLEYMRAEKIGNEYVLKCPSCEEPSKKDDNCWE
jgi:hypothetical protein